MITRGRLGCVAVLLLLSTATASFAQKADSAATARTGALPGRGSIGGQAGISSFLAEKDYSDGAMPRIAFAGHFRYVVNNSFRWQVSPYFTWSAYKVDAPSPFTDANFPADTTKDHYLTQLVGASAQLQYTGKRGKWNYHFGAGPAVYRVVVQNRRKVVKDPVTFRLHQGTYLGATAEFGVERFLKGLPNTSLEWTAAYQGAFAKRDEQFPSGFNGAVHAVELRFGAHYYYDFNRPKKPQEAKKP